MVKTIDEVDWTVKITLCGSSEDSLEALSLQFAAHPEVSVQGADVLRAGCSAFVCPGNSFGYMDRGLALHVLESLGWELQDRLRPIITERFDGELLVGQAALMETASNPAWMLYAPVQRTSLGVGESLAAYLATRGALLVVRDHNREHPGDRIESVAVPLLGVEECSLQPATSARQIRYAYEQVAGMRGLGDKNLSNLSRREKKLLSVPRIFDAARGDDEEA